MKEENHFEKHFDYGSILPILLFMFGIYAISLIIHDKDSTAMIMILLSFVVYIANNVLINVYGFSTTFNEYLEDIASFTSFGLTTVVFGLKFFQESFSVVAVVFFYSTCLILALARNWIVRLKNSNGWPIALNGLFFPLAYYVYLFYLQEPGKSIFIIFYLVIGFLSLTHKNFLGYQENNKEKVSVIDEWDLTKKKKRI